VFVGCCAVVCEGAFPWFCDVHPGLHHYDAGIAGLIRRGHPVSVPDARSRSGFVIFSKNFRIFFKIFENFSGFFQKFLETLPDFLKFLQIFPDFFSEKLPIVVMYFLLAPLRPSGIILS